MPSTISESDRQRLADIVSEIASEYEGQGYEVKLQPTPADLPDFLKDFRPDLIATGKNETVVVEVKTRDGLRNAHSVAALESALRDRPGWRFELIMKGQLLRGRKDLVRMKSVRRSTRQMNFKSTTISQPLYFCYGRVPKVLCGS